jgi:hypothetical protein
VTEHELQSQVVDALRLAGFPVRETTAFRQKTESGVDKGIADLLIPVFPFAMLCIEMKKPGKVKWSSPEQEKAYKDREFYLAQSISDVLNALTDFAQVIPRQHFPAYIQKVARFEQIARQA